MRPLILLAALPLALAVPLRAQQAEPGTAPSRFEVAGRVLDGATGEPVADAVVRLTDVEEMAVSDSAGRFVLRRIPMGTHPWQISRLGYSTWNEDVEASPGDEFTIRPPAPGGLGQLHGIHPADVHSIEMFTGGTMVRVYTEWFMQRAAKEGVTLMPLGYSPGHPVIGALNPTP